MAKIFTKEQILVDKEYLRELRRKAAFFEEVLSFLEDKYLGFLMKETEKEADISLARAKKELK